MEKMQILFPEPQLARLRQIAREEDRPVSELVRSAIDFWLNRKIDRPADWVSEPAPAYRCGAVQMPPEGLRDVARRDL